MQYNHQRLLKGVFVSTDVANALHTVSYTMLTVTWNYAESCVPSGLDFVHTYVGFIIPSVVTVLVISLSQCQKMKNCDESEEETARRLVQKMDQNKNREPKCSHYHVKSAVRLMSERERSSG